MDFRYKLLSLKRAVQETLDQEGILAIANAKAEYPQLNSDFGRCAGSLSSFAARIAGNAAVIAQAELLCVSCAVSPFLTAVAIVASRLPALIKGLSRHHTARVCLPAGL